VKDKFNYQEILKIAGSYIAVCIGAGFATGQEIMLFYSSFGLKSILGGFVCMALLVICGAIILKTGNENELSSNSEVFSFFCGRHIGMFFKTFMPVLLLSTFVIMISGAGAAMNQYFGIAPSTGRLIMIVLVLGSLYLGFEKITKILGGLGNIIIIISLIIGIVSTVKNIDGLSRVNDVIKTLNITRAASSWWMSGILYASFSVLLATPFLVGVGKTATNKKNCLIGGALGGVVLMIAITTINLGILSNLSEIYTQQIPTLFLAEQISPMVATLFIGILIGCIYTASVPLLWVTCDTFTTEGSSSFNILAVALSIVGYLGGSFPYAKLVNFIYPTAGIAGMLLIACIFGKNILKRNFVHKKIFTLK
jgi:uncharacterized membrane protein YkvI